MGNIYKLSNKRFEIIHHRYNNLKKMFEVIMHDEFLNKDIILNANNLIELHKKIKDFLNEQGLSFDLRVESEPIQYKY